MSDENVELVLAAVDAYNAGDMDALLELWAPDIEARSLHRSRTKCLPPLTERQRPTITL